ncbi:ABC transporter permease [Acidicapsa ligni]|uniref:ABC transporter permease n=1 Tax=Acidicapsa ligni TaxID=542300 RepID=UPI0021E0E33A|nr:ABC transporter permease [Acidicapsa ligni]
MKRLYLLLVRMVAAPRSWFRATAHRDRLEAEMEYELADHLERLTADLIRAGYSVREANRRAQIALGSTVVHKDAMRASLGLRLWDELSADLMYAFRRLRRSVGFTLVAAISLALAIGANTTIFSFAKQMLYERLAVPDAAELRLLAWTGTEKHVAVHHIWGDYDPLANGQVTSSAFSYPAYMQLRAQNRGGNGVMQDLFAFKETGMNATVAGNAQPVQTEIVSGNYYSVLGIRPVLGRIILPSDDVSAGQGPVAVISYGLWEREFGRSPRALGQGIKLNDMSFTIIGVNPKSFTGAKSTQQSPDVFVPISMQPLISPHGAGSLLTDNNEWWVNVMGRIRPGISDIAAQTVLDGQLGAVTRATITVRPKEDVPRMDLRDGSHGLFAQQKMFAKPMAVLLTMVGFVLLLACANIANLMLARGTQRQREMSVRLALGAGRKRIVRQMLVESLVLAGLGGVGGVIFGFIGSSLAPKLTENAWERSDFHVHFDWMVLGFTAGITILTGVLFGLAPAWAASRAGVGSGLKESSQSVTRRRKGWGGKSLVGFQVALSTLLVIGAGLFLRTLASLNAVDVGFRTDHLLLTEISPPPKIYPAGKDIALHTRLLEAFAATPGVDAVSPAWVPYISDDISRTDFKLEGVTYEDDAEDMNVVGSNFFSMLRIPVYAGRSFGLQDTATSTKVGIINASLAKKRFPNQNPIGRKFSVGGHNSDGVGGKVTEEWIIIIGVCGDTRYASLRAVPPPQFFLPFSQQTDAGGAVTYEVQTRMSPEAIVPLLRKVVQRQDTDLPLINVRTQRQQIDSTTQQERIFVAMTSSFGMLALALASVGIYGVMAYSVANRTNEIGIRLALGAQPRQVLTMILREATWISLAGVAVGLIAALALAQAVKSMLYGLQPADPVSLISGAALLILVGLAASWLPARRAASVQPIEALRHE